MKFAFTSTIGAALAIIAIVGTPDFASAADINVVDARETPMMRTADDAAAMSTAARSVDVKIATADILSKPTGLVNKNMLAMDNNVAITRSNIVLSQNDRLKLAKKVEDLILSADAGNMNPTVLSKNVLKAASGKDSDAAIMVKASAVVAAKDEPAMRGQHIADLVNAVFDVKATDATKEQTIQSEMPRGVILLVGTKDILRQPTAVINKNAAISDNQITISRSTLAPSQNDAVAMAGNAKVADYVAPASTIRVAKTGEKVDDSEIDLYRVGFLYSKDASVTSNADGKPTTSKDENEQFGLWGGGLGFGWRYPLGYWNLYGAGLYGGGCGLGLGFGGFFYC